MDIIKIPGFICRWKKIRNIMVHKKSTHEVLDVWECEAVGLPNAAHAWVDHEGKLIVRYSHNGISDLEQAGFEPLPEGTAKT